MCDTVQDVEWFIEAADKVRCDELEGNALTCPEPYFVDFLRDAPEPTGDEPEDADMEAPKIYELVSVYLSPVLTHEKDMVRGSRYPVWSSSLRNWQAIFSSTTIPSVEQAWTWSSSKMPWSIW